MKMTSLFTIVFSLFVMANSYANDIDILLQCEWSKDYENFLLRYNVKDKEAAWYERGSKTFQLQFTSQEDCEKEFEKLSQHRENSKLVMCGCYASAYAPALFWGDQWWGFSRLNCIKATNSQNHEYTYKTKEIIRNDWEGTPAYNQQFELADYFDKDERMGQNYDLCKEKIPAIIKETL